MRVLDVLNDLASETSTHSKRHLLRQAARDMPDLKLVLRAALDPYVMYYVRSVPPVRGRMGRVPLLHVVRNVLPQLSSRKVTGNAAIALLESNFCGMHPDDEEVVRRILQKDLRCGVRAKTANAVFPKLVPEFKIQLAARDTSRAVYPCWIEPKLDGLRCLAVVSGKKPENVEFLSRGGRPFETLDHVARVLVTFVPPGYVLDGEVTGGTLQETQSSVKRDEAKTGDMFGAQPKFTAFDMLTWKEFSERKCEEGYEQRRSLLSRFHMYVPRGQTAVELAPRRAVGSEKEARLAYEDYRRSGFEGAMLKDPKGLYDFKRTTAWIKMKPEDTVDVTVTGVREGKGKYSGMLGALLFTHNGQQCSAGGGISDEERGTWWTLHKNVQSIIGRVMEVKFTAETDGGRTREARFVRFREDLE